MMKKISDDRLEQMLTDYCKADSRQPFVYDADRKQEKIIPFARFNKAAVTAASLVLVGALSLTVYFLFGNNNSTPFAVASSPQSVTTPITPTGESDGDSNQAALEPTQPKSLLQSIVDSLLPHPTENNRTDNNKTSPTESSRKPTATPSATEAARPKPTQTTGDQATEPSAVHPTEPQPIKATEIFPEPTVPRDPPWNDPEPTDPPDEGDEPGLIIPTEGGVTAIAPPTVYASISSSLLGNDDEWAYCKVYNSAGRRLGSVNLYDGTHIAHIVSRRQNVVSVEYDVPEGVITQPGYYSFVFYNDNGKLLAQVQEYCD